MSPRAEPRNHPTLPKAEKGISPRTSCTKPDRPGEYPRLPCFGVRVIGGARLDARGMELVLEPFDGAPGTATLVVENGDALMAPDGQLATSFDLPRNRGRAHLYRLVAGSLVSGAAWYILGRS